MKIGICPQCMSLMELTRHHIVPRCRGGLDIPSNILLVCRPCHDELDQQVGVRPARLTPAQRRRIKNGNCVCGNNVARHNKESGKCQRCLWAEQRREWHERRFLYWAEKGESWSKQRV